MAMSSLKGRRSPPRKVAALMLLVFLVAALTGVGGAVVRCSTICGSPQTVVEDYTTQTKYLPVYKFKLDDGTRLTLYIKMERTCASGYIYKKCYTRTYCTNTRKCELNQPGFNQVISTFKNRCGVWRTVGWEVR